MSTPSSKIPCCKFVTVGDGAVGKTALLTSYTTNQISTDYTPTVFDTKNAMTTMDDGKPVSMVLFDSAGQEDYDNLRVLSYPQTDVFILCFSLISQTSFDNIASRWVPELTKYAPDVPIVLVGTKMDLRTDAEMKNPTILNQLDRRGEKCVTTEQGQQLATQIKAHAYVECSAVTQENLSLVFKHAIAGWMKYDELKKKRDRKHKNCGCEIM